MLEKNLQALRSSLIPEFIEKIQQAEFPTWAEQIYSEDRSPNLLIAKGSKKKSLYDMKGWKEEIQKRLENFEFKPGEAMMIIGIGLGFFVQEALKKADEKHIFVIVEPNPGMLKAALSNVDISQGVKDNRVIIAPTTEDLAYTLELLNEKSVIENWNSLIEGYTVDNPEYQTISFDALGILNQIRCNIGTVANAGQQIADNDIANLPYVIHRRGVQELEGLYKGFPAVLVSTGPSLRKNLHLLIEAQDRVIIIAVGQALRPLLAYGIKPDFICSVDYGEVNLTHYEGLMESDVPLVALNRSFAPLLKRWQGPLFVAASPQIDMHPDHKNRVHKLLSDKGWTLQGGSVAHMCYGLGIHLGCSPLIMIGQDLAYDSEQSHFPQADSRGILKQGPQGDIKWEVKDPRCHLKGSDHSMGLPVPVPGYFGGEVITNVGLASFITSFERFIKAFPSIPIINATEGGANIPGIKRMSLKRALDIYCKDKIEEKQEKLLPLLSDCPNALELVEQAIPLLRQEISLLNQCQNSARKALDINKKLKALSSKKMNDHQAKQFNRLLHANQQHSNEAHQVAVRLPLVMLALYGAGRKINAAAMKVQGDIDHINANEGDAKIRIERNKIILEAAIDACRVLKKSYQDALQRLDRAFSARDISLLIPKQKEPEPSLLDAEEYFEAGNFARPMLEAKRILDNLENTNDYGIAHSVFAKGQWLLSKALDEAKALPDNSDMIDSLQLISDAQELGRKEKNFSKAKEMLSDAVEKTPDNEIAKWGLATACFHTGDYEESIKLYEELTEKHPDKRRYLFEMGQVMVCQGETKPDVDRIVQGIDKILEAMHGTEEFDSMLPIIGDLLVGLEKQKEAIGHYKEYLDKFPADYQVWEALASAYKKSGFDYLAIEAIEKARKIKGE